MAVSDNSKKPTAMGDALQRAIEAKPVATSDTRSNTTTQQQVPAMSQTTDTAVPVARPTNFNSLWKRPMSRTPLGEQLQAYIEALKETAKQGITDENFQRALAFDVLTTTAVPAILISLTMKVGNATHVGVFELLVEKGMEGTIADRILQDSMGQITLRRTAADAADTTMWRDAESAIRLRAGAAAEVHFSGSMVLPKDLSEKDTDQMRGVMYTALQAIYTVLEDTNGGKVPFSLDRLTANSQLAVTLDYAPGDVRTVTNLPLRSDIHVSLRATEQTNQSRDALVQARQVDLTHTDGFIDLIWNPPAAPAYYGAPPKSQQWNPRYVMTRVDTDLDAITLPGKLLALASTFAVGNNYAWAGAFLPRFASKAMRSGQRAEKNEVELRDLGALGLEVDLYGKGLARHSILNSKTTDDDLRMLVATTINPEMVFTLKIDEVGPSAWLDGVFLASARGDGRATQHIIDAANELTKGEFGKRWDPKKIIAIDDKVREHTGYYTARHDGQLHDLAEIDLLAVYNIYGDKDMDKVRRFQATYDAVNVSVLRRQADRLALLEEILGASYITLTGNSERCSLSSDFLQTLADSVVAAGADIRPMNVHLDFTGAAGRQQYNLAQVAMSQNQFSTLFAANRAGPTQYSNTGVYSRY